jgi:hypothetical protein
VVIDDFDLFCVCVSPKKTNSPLVIDSNAVLAFPILFKPLKAISRQGGQICQVHARGQRQKFSASRTLNIQGQLFRTASLKDSLSLGVAKAYDHVAIISCGVINARWASSRCPLPAFNPAAQEISVSCSTGSDLASLRPPSSVLPGAPSTSVSPDREFDWHFARIPTDLNERITFICQRLRTSSLHGRLSFGNVRPDRTACYSTKQSAKCAAIEFSKIK